MLAGADEDEDDAEELARAVHALGPGGGGRHRRPPRRGRGPAVRRRAAVVELPGRATPTAPPTARGARTPASLAAHLAHGFPLQEAAFAARAIAAEAVRRGLRESGAGAGPVDVLGVADRTPARQGAVTGRPRPAPGLQGLCHTHAADEVPADEARAR